MVRREKLLQDGVLSGSVLGVRQLRSFLSFYMEQEKSILPPLPLIIDPAWPGPENVSVPMAGKKARSRIAFKAMVREAINANIIHAKKNSQLPSYRTTLCPVSQ